MASKWIRVSASVADDLVTLGKAAAADIRDDVPVGPQQTPAVPQAPALPPLPTSAEYIRPSWFPRLEFAHQRSRGAILFGPRGSGKTRAVQELIGSGTWHGRTAFDGIGEEHLVGGIGLANGSTVLHHGPLALAVRDDCPFVLEEADRARPSLLSLLNNLTDGSGFPLVMPDGTSLAVGDGFRAYLTFNPGAAYGGRGMNMALRDRLVPILCDYPSRDVEARILAGMLPSLSATRIGQMLDCADRVRSSAVTHGFDLSVRALRRWADMVECGVARSWIDGWRSAIVDLAGSPAEDCGVRQILEDVASAAAMETWS